MTEYSFHSFNVDDMAMRYSDFAPRFFNFCLSLGMQRNSIMPSRAFCSDESQGYPIILLAKHFGIFPFNHGRVGGIVATDRHGPHAHHGKDVVLLQASHVGYEPETKEFGIYRRLQTEHREHSTDCGAICGVLSWYQEEYDFACRHVLLNTEGGERTVVIDNQFLWDEREEGIYLNIERLVSDAVTKQSFSTAKSFIASDELVQRVGGKWPEKRQSIGKHLYADAFRFKRKFDDVVASGLLNRNLIDAMPHIITSKAPALSAAQVNTQIEFDRTFRTIVKEKAYRGKKMVFISGIHIDISPREDQLFPLTKFVPWAAYIQNEKGEGYTLEQSELYEALNAQSSENPHKIDLTSAIHQMESEPEVRLYVDNEE